jgi:hypothetical protein
LKKHIKSTKIAEIEVEMKLYIDECARLRQQLEEVIKSKDTFADPQEVRIIEERFQQQEMAINNLRIENNDLVLAFNAKEEELRQTREILDKQKKGVSKDSTRLKRLIKDKDRDIVRMRGELQI